MHYLDRVKRYLAGEGVPFEADVDGRGQVSTAARLALSDAPAASQLRWLKYASVDGPVEVAAVASGPRVLEAVAPIVDRVVLCVGADPERIKWAMDIARTAASDYRKLRAELGFASYDEAEVLALLTEAGFSARRHHPNLGHNQARMAFLATPV